MVVAKISDLHMKHDTFDEFPYTLSSKREIQHPVDLVLGSTLSSMATYTMRPTEHQELQWQVQELLYKGFIWKSLSLYIANATHAKQIWQLAYT